MPNKTTVPRAVELASSLLKEVMDPTWINYIELPKALAEEIAEVLLLQAAALTKVNTSLDVISNLTVAGIHANVWSITNSTKSIVQEALQ